MRLETLIFPAVVAAATIESRQSFGTLKVAGYRTLKPTHDPKATRKISLLGPFDLKAAGANAQDSGQIQFFHSVNEGFCKNCTVLKGKMGLENIDGTAATPAQGVYIHHIITQDITKRSVQLLSGCERSGGSGSALSGLASSLGSSGLGGSKFIGTGEDNNNVEVWYTARDGSRPGGFQIGPNDRFFMNSVFVNYNKAPKKVYVTADLEYLPGKVGFDANEKLVSVEGCGTGAIKLSETGPTKTTSKKFTFLSDGAILLAKGHLHAGGEEVVLYINDKLICKSVAKYGGVKGESAIDEMTLCSQKPIPFKKGDKMHFDVVYDISKHPVRHESGGHEHSSGGGGMPDIMGMWNFVLSGSGTTAAAPAAKGKGTSGLSRLLGLF